MNPFDPFPVLATSRLLLRCLEAGDAETMYQTLATPDVARFSGKAAPASVEAVRAKIETILANVRAGEAISWALADAADGAFLGSAGLWRWDKANFRAEIGYELTPRHWGRGLMTEALKPVIALGFQRMKLHSVEAKVHPDNVGSMRVLEKLGFQKEAYFRENHWNEGRFEDTVVYSLLAPR